MEDYNSSRSSGGVMEDYNCTPPMEQQKDEADRLQVLYLITNRDRPAEEIVTDAKRLLQFVKTGK